MENLLKTGKVTQNIEQFEEILRNKISQRKRANNFRVQTGPYKIPVVVHIIHRGESIGISPNISDARVLSQIQVFNEDFNRLNADTTDTPPEFAGIAGNMNIEFVLAKQTPQGLPTTGIVRVNGVQNSWDPSDDEELKGLSYWPSEDYLNIWVTDLSGVYLGYAQFPVSNLPGIGGLSDTTAATDGVVIDYKVFGLGSEDPDYNKGRTVTHEMGHFFGLRHIWGDDSGCSATDYVDDTPNQGNETYGCPVHPQVDCSVNKMFQNYMDYTDDACMNLFTQGQVDRMTVILEDTDVPRRNSLLTSHGLNEPECDPDPTVDVAIARILQPGPVTCNARPQLVLEIENLSCPIITSIKVDYSINGGTLKSATVTGLAIAPATRSKVTIDDLNLTAVENSISISVALVNNQIDNSPGNSDTIITVIHNTTSDIVPLRKTFDDNQIDSWIAANPQEGMLWNIDTEYRARFPVQTGSIGEESWLVSPVLDFSSLTEASMFFDLTYTWNTQDNDRLRILTSTNCGDSYTEAVPGFDLQGSELDSDNAKKYLFLNSLIGFSDVRIAFVGTNDLGSNIYVDNIEFFLSNDPTPIDPGTELYAIYWDGFGGANITFNLPERQQVGISIVDIMGRQIENAILPDILNQTIAVPTGSVSSGLYIIRLQIGKKYSSTKIYLSQ